MSARPSWDDYFLRMAQLVATRATCPRRQVGSVLVREHRVVATGYNGAPSGLPHCTDVGCLMVDSHCARALHSEINALLSCALHGVSSKGCTLYCTDFPCTHCAKALVQAGIVRVVYLAEYPDANSAQVLHDADVRLERGCEEGGRFALAVIAPPRPRKVKAR